LDARVGRLSYSQFEYSRLSASKTLVIATVTNTGTVAGAEVAQLYIGLESAGSAANLPAVKYVPKPACTDLHAWVPRATLVFGNRRWSGNAHTIALATTIALTGPARSARLPARAWERSVLFQTVEHTLDMGIGWHGGTDSLMQEAPPNR
jgi:hypothetical protein